MLLHYVVASHHLTLSVLLWGILEYTSQGRPMAFDVDNCSSVDALACWFAEQLWPRIHQDSLQLQKSPCICHVVDDVWRESLGSWHEAERGGISVGCRTQREIIPLHMGPWEDDGRGGAHAL